MNTDTAALKISKILYNVDIFGTGCVANENVGEYDSVAMGIIDDLPLADTINSEAIENFQYEMDFWQHEGHTAEVWNEDMLIALHRIHGVLAELS